jgi:regulator of replication initiation timing
MKWLAVGLIVFALLWLVVENAMLRTENEDLSARIVEMQQQAKKPCTTTGQNETAFGWDALTSVTTSQYDTAIGFAIDQNSDHNQGSNVVVLP